MTFAAQFFFTPRASVQEIYTDNLFLTDNDIEDDFITTVSGGFDTQLLGKISGLEFTFDPSYEFYQEFSEFDEWGLLSNLRAWVNPSISSNLQLRNNFVRTTDPVDREDQLVVDGGRVGEEGDNTVRRGREPYVRNNARLNYSQQFGQEDRVYAGASYGLLRNDADDVEDNDNYRLNAGLDYWFTKRYGGELLGEYTRGEFDQQSGFDGIPSSDFDNWLASFRLRGRMSKHFALFFQYGQAYRKFTSGISNDYIIYALSAGFTYRLTEDTDMRLGLGYFYQAIEDQKDQNNIFLDWETTRTWNFPRGTITLNGLSGLTQNDFGAQSIGFQQFTATQVTAFYNFTRRFRGETDALIRLSRTPSDNENRADEDENEDDRQDIRLRFNAGLGYMLTRWMNVRLGYTFNFYNSNEDEDYSENRATLTITLEPDLPWRLWN